MGYVGKVTKKKKLQHLEIYLKGMRVVNKKGDEASVHRFVSRFDILQLNTGEDKLLSHLKLNLNVVGREMDLFT